MHILRRFGVIFAALCLAAMMVAPATAKTSVPTVAPAIATSATTGNCATISPADPTAFENGFSVGQAPGSDKWSGAKVTINVPSSLSTCTTPDPDNPDYYGDFVFISMYNGTGITSPFAVSAGSTVSGRAYANYIAIGFYRCVWTGDSSCGQSGVRAFASWGTRNLGTDHICTTDDSVGIRDLGTITSGSHTFELTYENLGGNTDWAGRIDGVLKINLSHPDNYSGEDPSCWNDSECVPTCTGDHSIDMTMCRAWDMGDGWCGSSTNKLVVSGMRQRFYGGSYGLRKDAYCKINPNGTCIVANGVNGATWYADEIPDTNTDGGNLWTTRP